MKITILTLFPDLFEGFKQYSIIKRLLDRKIFELEIVNFRKFSKLNNQRVDDTPYGGGGGMLLMIEPIVDAIKSVRTKDSKVFLLSPQGEQFTQSHAKSLSAQKHIILICGHYEGFDARIKHYIDGEISIGDYVLTGGETASMIITEAITRLLPGSINEQSLEVESFNNDLLDYDNYTKPDSYDNHVVPSVLTSGNHKLINEWRIKNQIAKTKDLRPDLYKKFIKNKELENGKN